MSRRSGRHAPRRIERTPAQLPQLLVAYQPTPSVSAQETQLAGRMALSAANGLSGVAAGAYQAHSSSATNAVLQSAQQSQQWPGQATPGHPYPAMPKVSNTKPLLDSLGATGTAIFGGIITSEEYNPDFYWRDAVNVYEQMLRNDGQIVAIRQQLELPLRRASWSIKPASTDPKDIEIASFVESCLFHDMRYTTSEGRTLTQKWDDILRHILMHLWFGFMAFEQCYRIEDGWVKWARWTPLLPRTLWRWWVGEDTEIVGVQQWTFKDYSYRFVDIPADKLLLFANRQEGNNFEGVSLLRAAYKHWYYKDQFYKIDAIGLERNAISIPVIFLPENFTGDDVSIAQKILGNLRANESMGATLPPGWQIEYIRNNQKYSAQVMPSIQHHDTLIARSVLAQFIQLGSTETGAYALADAQIETFLEALQAVAEYIEDVVNSDAIPRLVDYNYDGVAVYPELTCAKLAAADIKDLAAALAQLAATPTPIITSDADLEDWVRKQMGLPQANRSAVNATNPTAPSDPARPDNANASDHGDQQSDPTPESHGKTPTNGKGADGENGDAATASSAALAATISTHEEHEEHAAEHVAWAQEAHLLREALASAYGMDAVARGLRSDERGELQLFNPYHDHSNGQFTSGPSMGPDTGGGSGGGIGHGHGGGKGAASSGGEGGKGAAPKGASAPPAPSDHHWEGKSTYGNWSPQYKGETAVVDAHAGKGTMTLHKAGHVIATYSIEADHEYGGYKVTKSVAGKTDEVKHGLSVKGVNDHLKSEIGGPLSASGYKLTKGQLLTKDHLEPPGAKPSAAQKAINKATEDEAKAKDWFDYKTKGGTQAATIYPGGTGGHVVEYHGTDGSMLRVTRNADDSYTLERFKVNANATVSPAKSAYKTEMDPLSGAGQHSYEEQPSLTKTYKTSKGVQNQLDSAGYGNKFKEANLQPHYLHSAVTGGTGGNASTAPAHFAGVSSSVSPHSTTGYNQAFAYNVAHGQLAELNPGKGVGAYDFQIGHTQGTLLTASDANHSMRLTYQKSGSAKEAYDKLTQDEARANLVKHGFTKNEADMLVDMSRQDASEYGASKAHMSPELQARVAYATARKAELDAKYGQYDKSTARDLVKQVYKDYPELRSALDLHLSGGPDFQESHIASKVSSTFHLSAAQRTARAQEGLGKLREISEWSLYHQGNVTRAGTIRLFHGTNGTSSAAKWDERLAGNGSRRGTPFTSLFSVARSFTGGGGAGLISAHVPVEMVSVWHGIRGDSKYVHEKEYTVTIGHGEIHDHHYIKPK